jgi:thiamine-phosphate pyrophosphorylase
MTDERLGDDLWRAIGHLPRGSGIVFRHYATPPTERRAMFRRVVRMARARGLIVVRAGERCGFNEMGTHGPVRRGGGLRTMPAHSRAEAVAALRRGADAVFVSPVFATDSHPGAPPLGVSGAQRIVQGLPVRAIALGGMNASRFRETRGFYGWAAIGAWL